MFQYDRAEAPGTARQALKRQHCDSKPEAAPSFDTQIYVLHEEQSIDWEDNQFWLTLRDSLS